VLPWKQAVRVKATAPLAANTYANGTSGVGATLTATANGALAAIDGVTLAANDRVLVDQEATGSHNGIYVVTQVGDSTHPYILTRATDADSGAKLVSAACKVSEGTTFADQEWQCTTNATITVGTTAVVWVQAGGGAAIAIDDEGTTLTSAPTSINFTGAGVRATASGADVTVDIPGVSGITGGALTLIAQQTLAADGVPADFTSIAATYQDLIIVIRGRGSAAATEAAISLRFNGDSGANYDWRDVFLQSTYGTSPQFAQTSLRSAVIVADSAPAGTASLAEISIGGYRNATFHKSVIGRSNEKTANTGTNALIYRCLQGTWRSMAAINQISFLESLKAGSVISLYGRS